LMQSPTYFAQAQPIQPGPRKDVNGARKLPTYGERKFPSLAGWRSAE
jgi:hypothetical protein